MTGDIPTISNMYYGSNTSTYSPQQIFGGTVGATLLQQQTSWSPEIDNYRTVMGKMHNIIDDIRPKAATKKEEPMSTRRLVQVFIADPDENIPLDQCLLYQGEQKLTDLTDQELYFEINIKEILDAHNTKRTKILNKKVKEREEYLEPARVRDLKMVVVTLAQF